ncbi:hypothetical protein AB4144_26195, partial [Rhizobiaceae sp. 2RAB30]
LPTFALSRMAHVNFQKAALELAAHHISEGNRRIGRQRALIAALNSDRHDTQQAEETLDLLRATRETWKAHRMVILEAICRLRQAGKTPTPPL